jgi:protein-disulfide isomerase
VTDLRSAVVPPLGERDRVRGPDEAPALVAYVDFTCPRCALAHARLAAAPLRVAYRHFALRAKHPRAIPLACAVEAAGEQDAYWAMVDALFADQGRIDDPHLWERARLLGLDVERFETERRAPELLERVREQTLGGIRAGVAETPTLFVEGTAHPGPPEPSWLAAVAGRRRANR